MSAKRLHTERIPADFAKGALAGLVGGAAGAAAKLASERLFPPRPEGHVAPTALVAEQLAPALNGNRRKAERAIYFLFGALAGAVYGGIVEFEPSLAAWRGAAFGITLNRITHESVLPRLGLTEHPRDRGAQERISEWVTHAVYGVAADTVRRLVRKRM